MLGQSAVDVQALAGRTAAAASTFDQLLDVGMDSSVMWAPEVMSLKFRYFDGSNWRSSWDSLARKGLPVGRRDDAGGGVAGGSRRGPRRRSGDGVRPNATCDRRATF